MNTGVIETPENPKTTEVTEATENIKKIDSKLSLTYPGIHNLNVNALLELIFKLIQMNNKNKRQILADEIIRQQLRTLANSSDTISIDDNKKQLKIILSDLIDMTVQNKILDDEAAVNAKQEHNEIINLRIQNKKLREDPESVVDELSKELDALKPRINLVGQDKKALIESTTIAQEKLRKQVQANATLKEQNNRLNKIVESLTSKNTNLRETNVALSGLIRIEKKERKLVSEKFNQLSQEHDALKLEGETVRRERDTLKRERNKSQQPNTKVRQTPKKFKTSGKELADKKDETQITMVASPLPVSVITPFSKFQPAPRDISSLFSEDNILKTSRRTLKES